MIFDVANSKISEASEKYFQEIKTDIQLPEEAGKNVISLFQTRNNIVAVTTYGVYRFSNEKWSGKTCGTGFQTATLDSKENVWLVNRNSIQNEEGSVKLTLPSTAKNDTILCLFWEDETLHVGTSNGMLSYNGKWQAIPISQGKRVNSIALDKSGQLWLASNKGLLKRTEKEWRNLDEMIMAKGTQEIYFSLHTPKDVNDLLFSSPFSVGCIADNGQHWMWSGKDGLPYGPVTTIKSHKQTLWFGTDKGAAKKDDKWHYYHGKRWLPNNKINDILPINEQTVWIATPNGISQIQQVEMTLEEKAAHFEKVIDARHNRRGLINISHLTVPGDISSSKMMNEDNDGLWTSTYLAAECFRYAVTKSDEAKENAIRTYEALERLETVTGIPGLPARSYAMTKDVVEQSRSPHPKIWRSSPDKEWQWLDDCSSDEIVGHMFAISIFYDLVADNKMKNSVKELVQRTMDHIIDNDFHLIDYDGKPTRWGVWHPDSLNHSKNWAYEKGLYSLEILSFLKTAVYITGNQKYEKTYRHLIENHNYAENTVEAKIHGSFEKSYAEDILTYFPYYCLSRYASDDEYWPLYKKSIERTWPVSQPDRIPAWNIIASVVLQKDCNLKIAREELELFPLDLIDWRMTNNHRWDLIEDELVDRGGNRQATRTIPTPESRIFRWNTNPYEYDTGSDGKREVSGTYFLLPYWMARYHKLFN
ncbi:MAG: transcriptional regulator [Bacteroidetes bacterium]|nr:transcriptional regulator [Bacteroidota bacterium]